MSVDSSFGLILLTIFIPQTHKSHVMYCGGGGVNNTKYKKFIFFDEFYSANYELFFNRSDQKSVNYVRNVAVPVDIITTPFTISQVIHSDDQTKFL